MSGLEVIASIASVAQLAGVVYSISRQLYEVGDALSHASSDITDLAHDLEIFSEELLLHATLVNAANSRYSDQVNRLTAKIIGRCATICVKIDCILKKLRKGGVWAKLKWLYKEKELKKLLERLRDLKLSLMGTLTHLRTLKADYMMDALGVGKPSLLKGEENEEMSKETIEDIEETRRKLAEVSVSQKVDFKEAQAALRTQINSRSCGTSDTTDIDDSFDFQGCQNDFSSQNTSSTQLSSVVSMSPKATKANYTPLISTIDFSENLGIDSVLQNRSALDSVQSFHSALSHQTDNSEEMCKENFPSEIPNCTNQSRTSQAGDWMTDMVELAIKHCGMSREEAKTWASSLPKPTKAQVNHFQATACASSSRNPSRWSKTREDVFISHSDIIVPMDDNGSPRTTPPQSPAVTEGQDNSHAGQPHFRHLGYGIIGNDRKPPRMHLSGEFSTSGQAFGPSLGWDSRGNVALPEIYVHNPNPYGRFHTSSSSNYMNSTSSPAWSSIPMSIPSSRDPVPPPLPPPQHLRHLADIADGGNNGPDIAWQWGNSHEDNRDWGRSIATPGLTYNKENSLWCSSVSSTTNADMPDRELITPNHPTWPDMLTNPASYSTAQVAIPPASGSQVKGNDPNSGAEQRRASLPPAQANMKGSRSGFLPLFARRGAPLQQPLSMNPSPPNGQIHLQTPMTGIPDFGSFAGNMANLAAQQQQQGLLAASSSVSESRSPPQKAETPWQSAGIANQASPTDFMTPRTSGSGESSITASTFSTITSSFQAVNFSPGLGSSHKRSASQAQLPETDSYQPSSPGSGSRPSGNYNQMTNQNNFTCAGQSQFYEVYGEGGNAQFTSYTTTPQLPLLRIPEETYTPDQPAWVANLSPRIPQQQQMLNSHQIEQQRLQAAAHQQQSQTQARLNAQAKAQHMANQGQPSGVRPALMRPQHSPAMGTLNTPLRAPSQKMNNSEPPQVKPNAQFGLQQSQVQALLNAEAKAQQITPQGQRGGMGPVPMPRPAMGTGLSSSTVYAEAPQYGSPDLRIASSDYSTASGPSASSLTMGSAHSIHGHIIPEPEYGRGLTPEIVTYNNYGHNEYTFQTSGMDDFTLEFNPAQANSNSSYDPLILYPPYAGRPSSATQSNETSAYPPRQYPTSPSFSHMSRSPRPIKQGSQSPYPSSYGSTYPYPPPRRPSLASHQSYGRNNSNFSSEESKKKRRCTYPKCGKLFKDLKAHILTHQNDCYRGSEAPVKNAKFGSRAVEFPSNAQLAQLWWIAFSKMLDENSPKCSSLRTAWKRSIVEYSLSDAPSDEDVVQEEVKHLQEVLEQVISQLKSFTNFASNSLLGRFGRILEILNVVRNTVGFGIGAFAWVCICKAIENRLENESNDEIKDQEAIFAAFADVATLVARYTVMENMYQNWPGMSLEPYYEKSIISLCIQVLTFLERGLSSQDLMRTLSEDMAKINEADAFCREFKVTVMQEMSNLSVDDVSEDDFDSEGTLEAPHGIKRRIEDISVEESDSDSTEVAASRKEVTIRECPSLKRVKI